MLSLDPHEAQEWARKIVELYMSWYTFFVGANLLVMGWFHSKDVKTSPSLNALSGLFAFLNICGVGSSIVLMRYLSGTVPELQTVIYFCGTANSIGLVGIAIAWTLRIFRPDYRTRKAK
jgi:hypothetical protein